MRYSLYGKTILLLLGKLNKIKTKSKKTSFNALLFLQLCFLFYFILIYECVKYFKSTIMYSERAYFVVMKIKFCICAFLGDCSPFSRKCLNLPLKTTVKL